MSAKNHGWKPGPLPPDTYNWGGVTTADAAGGFYFADFCGDHVMCPGADPDGTAKRVEAADVVLFNNSLTLPPQATGRVGG